MDHAVIYCRISADPEGRELGVARQEEDCRALAARMGLNVTQVFVENDVSASTISTKPRPLYSRMLAEVPRGATIIAYSNSRLTRRPMELEDLLRLNQERGVNIATVVSGQDDLATADGRMIARIKGNVDAAEAERVAERVRRAKAQAVAEGRYRGGRRPFGYEADGVTIRGAEAELIRQGVRDVLAGRSMRAIAADWEGSGTLGRTATNQASTRVRRILLRPRNAGLMEAHGEIVGAATWPAIITPDEHHAVVAILTNPARRTTPGPGRRHLLSGIATCAICNDGTTVNTTSSRGRPSYTCARSKHVIRATELIDAATVGVVHELLSDPRLIDALRPVEHSEDSQGDRDRSDALRARLRAVEADYAEGLVTGRQLRDATQRIEAELQQIMQREASRLSGSALGELVSSPDPVAVFDAAPLDKRQAIIALLMDVSIGAGGRGRPKGWTKGDPYADLTGVTITRRSLR
ncbi:recombinase family protein [Microbacterium capsulatum]|uniref:Recombinase family protein n=1 Tax=Microbacterium capsulatum TaxID=3041921 RepID=A0ABU0XHU8_9MICO|nr:recombinase family protein [Microbacterium sp. ASV81]MDQ4213275.1 recombinase family protein [Microbacterium sp. ASV81]